MKRRYRTLPLFFFVIVWPSLRAAPASIAYQSALGSPHDPGIYVSYFNGRERAMVKLEPAEYQRRSKEGGKPATAGWIPAVQKEHARLQISDPQAVFYFYFAKKETGTKRATSGRAHTPEEFTLLRLEVKKESREGLVLPKTAAVPGYEKPNVAFDFQKVGPDVYEVRPRSPLRAGEYCFLTPDASNAFARGAAATNVLFDFGVAGPR